MKLKSKKSKEIQPDFKIITLLQGNEESDKKLLILAHKDIDGLISAFLLAVYLKDNYSKVDVLFTHPGLNVSTSRYLNSHNRIGKYSKVCLVDISLDFKNKKSSLVLFNVIKNKLYFMFDHHIGWAKELKNIPNFNVNIKGEVDRKCDSSQFIIIDESAISCSKLIYDSLNFSRADDFLAQLVAVANISDDLIFREKCQGTDMYKIFMMIKNNNIEKNIKLFNTYNLSNWEEAVLRNNDFKIAQIQKLIENSREIYPGVCYISVDRKDNINYTLLSEYAYKGYNVLIIKQLDAKLLKMTYLVSHIIPDLNLVKVFNLRSGNPKKICLTKKYVNTKYILDKLKPYLKNERD